MKKLFACLLAILMVLNIPALPAKAAETGGSYENFAGDTVTWSYDSATKTLTLGGNAEVLSVFVADYVYPWAEYIPEIEAIVIEDGIEDVGLELKGYPALKTLSLPSTITMTMSAFQDCASLETVILADGIKSLGTAAFKNCSSLKNIAIPASVEYVEVDTFSGCYSIEAFQVASGNAHMSVGANGELIRDDYLLEVPASVKGEYTVPSYVIGIQESAFELCQDVTGVTIPGTVGSVNIRAFMGSAVTTVYFTGDAPEGTSVFMDSKVEKVYYPEDNATWTMEAMEKLQGYGTAVEWMPYEPIFDIYLDYNDLGTVEVSAERSPANQYITIDVTPAREGVVGYVYVYYDSTEELDLKLEQASDTQVRFLMPACDVLVEVVFIDTQNPFVDVEPSSYCYEPVLWANSMGITTGVDATHFAPNNPCTRGQVVTFLWRAAGCPAPASDVTPFTDVSAGDYYNDAVLWAVENGITKGISETEFAPNANCTRAQIVTFLWRAMGSPDPIGYEHPFSDIDATEYYYNAVLWAVEYGITNGITPTTFGPGDTCTRGQIVTFLFRAMA